MKRGTKAVGKTHFLELSSLLHSIHSIHTGVSQAPKIRLAPLAVRVNFELQLLDFS